MSSSSNGNHSDKAPDSNYLDEVIAEYIRACESGQPPDRDELLAKHPDLADELREFFANRDQMDQVALPMRNLAARVLNVRCPHCHNPIELLDRAPLADISCPSCGSSFSLVGDKTEAHFPAGSKTIQHFELLEHVGIGAFGSVWKARDTKLDRTVAIKIPRRHQLNESETEMFLRDARASAQLKHPNIVGVHEVGKQNGSIYIVSDFIQGVTLKEWMAAKPLTPRETAELCIKIAKALHHAHEAGVIHRDLKPSNIMMERKVESRKSRVESKTDSGSSTLNSQPSTFNSVEPHLVDFGLAKREAGEITMTVEGQILGTPAYMCPEQARGEGYKVDRRADIYSLGVILFELLTGELPFRGEKQMLIVQILKDDPPSPRKLNSSVPRDLETICLKCLEKEAGRRYDTANDFAEELRRYLNQLPILARPLGRTARINRWCRRNPTLAGMFAVLALLLLAVATVSTGAYFREALLRRDAQNARDNETRARETAESLLGDLQAAEERLSSLTELASDRQKDIDISRRELARTHVRLAAARLAAGDVEGANSYLKQCPDELRFWDWHFYNRQCVGRQLLSLGPGKVVAFSPDGTMLAIADKETTRVESVSTGEVLQAPGSRGATALAFSHDGQCLAYGDLAGNVTLWRIGTDEIRTLASHEAPVTSLAFEPNGKRLASVGKEVIIWNLADWRMERALVGERIAGFSSDGRSLVTVHDGGKEIKIYNIDEDIAPETIPTDLTNVGGLTFSGDLLALGTSTSSRSGSGVPEVQVWNLATRTKQQLILSKSAFVTRQVVHTLAFGLDRRRLVAGISRTGNNANREEFVVWKLATGTVETRLGGRKCRVRGLAFSPNGELLASADDTEVGLWDVRIPEQGLVLNADGANKHSIAFSPNGQYLASAGGSIRVWNLGEGTEAFQLEGMPTEKPFHSVQFSPDGRRLAAAGYKGIWCWDTVSRRLLWKWTKKANSVSFSPDGELLVVAIGTGTEEAALDVRLIKASNGQELRRLEAPPDNVYCVAFSRDGQTVAIGGRKTVWLTNVATGQMLYRMQTKEQTYRLDFSPDGGRMAVGQKNDHVQIFDAFTGEELVSWQDEQDRRTTHTLDIAFSPDGALVATAGQDYVSLWDAVTGELAVRSVAQSGRVEPRTIGAFRLHLIPKENDWLAAVGGQMKLSFGIRGLGKTRLQSIGCDESDRRSRNKHAAF